MPDPTSHSVPDPAELRKEYLRDKLLESDLLPDPIAQFAQWFADAELAHVEESNVMTLATAGAGGIPSARVVLLKGFDERGFTFYTNYASRKGRELEINPQAALVFYWQPLERQVRIDGIVERVSRQESDEYFHSRPLASQIGAWVSHQSEVVGSREEIDRRAAELTEQYKNTPVPLPDFWGGYRVVPHTIEFWQGRPSRLHDRLRYVKRNGDWKIERLAP